MKTEPEINFPAEPNFEEDFAPLTNDDRAKIYEIKNNGTYNDKVEFSALSQRVLLEIHQHLRGLLLVKAIKHIHPRYRVWCSDHYNDEVMTIVITSLSVTALCNFIRDDHRYTRSILFSLPINILPEFITHKEYAVRRIVAERIDPSYLPLMMDDENNNVRIAVISRIDPFYLPDMMVDRRNYEFAAQIIERIDPGYLFFYMKIGNDDTRAKVARRIEAIYLPQMIDDKVRAVRVEVARRIDPSLLGPLLGDPTSEVREIAYARIAPEAVPKRHLKKFNERVAKSIMET